MPLFKFACPCGAGACKQSKNGQLPYGSASSWLLLYTARPFTLSQSHPPIALRACKITLLPGLQRSAQKITGLHTAHGAKHATRLFCVRFLRFLCNTGFSSRNLSQGDNNILVLGRTHQVLGTFSHLTNPFSPNMDQQVVIGNPHQAIFCSYTSHVLTSFVQTMMVFVKKFILFTPYEVINYNASRMVDRFPVSTILSWSLSSPAPLASPGKKINP